MDKSQVLRMDKHLSKSGSTAPENSPRIVAACRRLVINNLKPLMNRLFENADDVLFDMADKAENNTIQSQYFDAMRLVRIKRHALEEGFYKRFTELFNEQWKQENSQDEDTSTDDFSLENATLINNDDLEESLAITNMISKADNRSPRELNALLQRFENMSNGRKISNETIPMGSSTICKAFRESLKTLELDISIKLIIYKLFDKYIITNLDSIYSEANKMLVKAGVLPNLRIKVRKSRNVSPRKKQSEKSGAQDQEHQGDDGGSVNAGVTTVCSDTGCAPITEQDDVLDTIQQLLSAHRDQGSAAGNDFQSGGNVVHIPSSRTGNVRSESSGNTVSVTHDTQGILDSLAQVQKKTFTSPILNEQLLSREVTLKSLLFDEINAQGDGNSRITINRNDEDIIDIVSMLFEFIIEDRNIPDSVKALLGRLQMTILRVSLLDRDFISKKTHPARKLLNEMSNAAIGLDENQDITESGLYNKIKYVVNRILTEYDNDVSLFSELLNEFEAYLEQEKKNDPNKAFDEVVTSIEDNDASRKDTKELIAEEIRKRIEGKDLPPLINVYLEGPWSELLVLLHTEEGPESTMLENALRVADLLIWSVKPKVSLENKQRLLLLIPGLLKALRHGMELLSYLPDDIEKIVGKFQPYHTASLRGCKVEEAKNENNVSDENEAENAGQSTSAIPLVDLPESELVYTKVTHEDKEQIDDEVIEEIVLSESLDTSDAELDITEEEKDDEYTDMVRSATVGMWFEFMDEVGNLNRARLSRITLLSSHYVFVTRNGEKVLEKSFHGLAAELRRNTARIIENVPLMDRALHAVVSGLRTHINS